MKVFVSTLLGLMIGYIIGVPRGKSHGPNSNEFDLKKFSLNSSINTSTMIVSRLILKNIKFKKVKKLEDYLFKCEILKMNINALKINSNLASYRILKSSRSGEKLKNVFYLWIINKKFLKYNFFQNIFSILSISFNSIKKYGLK